LESGGFIRPEDVNRPEKAKPNHSNLSPNPSGPIKARHRWRRSEAEYAGSVAVSLGGMGNSSV
jgi:hypothetical protein